MSNNGRKPPILPTMGRRPQLVGQPQHGGFDPRVKAAFEAQNREIQKIGEAFNTMRLFCIALIERLSPEEKKVVLSATRLNEIGDNMRRLGVNVENPAESEEVTLTVVENPEETTMSVSMSKEAELEKNKNEMPPPPTVEEVMEDFPRSCICQHLNTVHIARSGKCKASDNGVLCDCQEFTEKKIVI
jgi:hypothetical protein